jgi:hypothetical protein
MAEREIKKSLGQMVGDVIVNGYLKKTGGFHEVNRLRTAVGMAPLAKARGFSRTIKGNVNESALHEIIREHAELNCAEDAWPYSAQFYQAVHTSWVAKTGRGLNELERDALDEFMLDIRRKATVDAQMDIVDELLEEHADLITEEDHRSTEAVERVMDELPSRILVTPSPVARQRAIYTASLMWKERFGEYYEC